MKLKMLRAIRKFKRLLVSSGIFGGLVTGALFFYLDSDLSQTKPGQDQDKAPIFSAAVPEKPVIPPFRSEIIPKVLSDPKAHIGPDDDISFIELTEAVIRVMRLAEEDQTIENAYSADFVNWEGSPGDGHNALIGTSYISVFGAHEVMLLDRIVPSPWFVKVKRCGMPNACRYNFNGFVFKSSISAGDGWGETLGDTFTTLRDHFRENVIFSSMRRKGYDYEKLFLMIGGNAVIGTVQYYGNSGNSIELAVYFNVAWPIQNGVLEFRDFIDKPTYESHDESPWLDFLDYIDPGCVTDKSVILKCNHADWND